MLGTFKDARWWAVPAAAGVILAALYLLWAYQRSFHGPVTEANRSFPELKLSEAFVMAPLIGLIIFLGVYPKPVLDRIEPSAHALVVHVDRATHDHPGSVPTPQQASGGDR